MDQSTGMDIYWSQGAERKVAFHLDNLQFIILGHTAPEEFSFGSVQGRASSETTR